MKRLSLYALCVVVISGCASQIKELPSEPNIEIPEKWEVIISERSSDVNQDDDGTEETSDEIVPQAEIAPSIAHEMVHDGWLNSFADDELEKYVQLALENNPDLLVSAATLKTAIESVTITGANLWPSVSANLRNTNTDTDEDGVSTDVRTISGTLSVSWEADIWGKLTQRRRAAVYDALAQSELYKTAELSLVANVSRAWYNLVTNKLQLDLAYQRLDSFRNTADLIEENYKRGLRSALDVYSSRTDVQTQISSLADTKIGYIESLRTFKSLLGQYPDTDLEFTATLPDLNTPIPAGLPAQLLTRRPDIKASQLQYQAEIANAKAANRDRYPSITFNGSISDSRDSFNKLFEDNNMVMSLVTGLTQPVFQAGQLQSREQQALFQAEAAYASLVQTTLNAYEEVENALSRETLLTEQRDAIQEAVGFAENGFDLALDRYQSGIENYTTVLESQRRLFDSKRSEINIRNAILQNRIGTHLALGGDFTDIERIPEENLPTIYPEVEQESSTSVQQSREIEQTSEDLLELDQQTEVEAVPEF
ncbi:MAG: TolC family protein [Acidiferrobacterales bacterium]|nr:TolC family protein [Acidiferrobacterales bacterium]